VIKVDAFIETIKAFLEWAQKPAIYGTAISFTIGGYFLMWGGDQGRGKSIKWFIGAAVGLIIVLGSLSMATSMGDNVKF
jgi:preprotein translocase subunit SecY